MNKLKIVIFVAFTFLITPLVVNACPNPERIRLNHAANVMTTNWIVERDTREETVIAEGEEEILITEGIVFFGQIFGLTRDLYVVISNSFNNERLTLRYDDVIEGIIRFSDFNANQIIRYTMEVRVASGECQGEAMRTLNLTIPMVNEMRNEMICTRAPEHHLCREFLEVETNRDFLENHAIILEYLERREATEEAGTDEESASVFDRIFVFLENYSHFIIGGAVLVIAGITTFIIIKRKRSVK